MKILCAPSVEYILNIIYTDYSIAFVGRNFSDAFYKWNYEFCKDITDAIYSFSTRYIGRTCDIDLDVVYDANNVLTALIHSCSINVLILRNVEIESNSERISKGLPSVPPSTLLGTPPVDASKSPNFWSKPTTKSFVVPPTTRILTGSYYNGLKIGYYNKRYTIIDANGKPLVEKWFNKKPKFFKHPIGKLNIIAHVSYNDELYAISMDGKMYDMNKMWNNVHLDEVFVHIMDNIIDETIHSYKNQILSESRSKVIRINKTQLYEMIESIIDKLIA